MSALLPASAIALAGFFGASASHALVTIGIIACSIGITVQGTLTTAPLIRSTGVGVWMLVLGLAAVLGTSSGAYAAAAEMSSRQIADLGFTTVTGRIDATHRTPAGMRITLRRWEGSTARVDLSSNKAVHIHLSDAQSQSTRLIQAGRTISVRSGDLSHTPLEAWTRNGVLHFRGEKWDVWGQAGLRGRAVSAISESLKRTAGSASPLLQALVLGDTSAIEPATMVHFARSGTMHLLALSGMHLGVLALVAGGIGKMVGGPRTALFATLTVAVAYIALVGPRPGLVRAALLVATASTLRGVGRRQPLARSLAVAFLIHIVVDPLGVSSLGFQLSYLSLAGIAVIAPVLVHVIRGRVPTAVAAPLAAGLGAQIATLPLVLATFGTVSVLATLASAVITPLILLLMVAGIALSTVSIVLPGLVGAARVVLEQLARAVEELGALFGRGPTLTSGPTVAGRVSPPVVIATVAAVLVFTASQIFRFHIARHPNQLWRGRI